MEKQATKKYRVIQFDGYNTKEIISFCISCIGEVSYYSNEILKNYISNRMKKGEWLVSCNDYPTPEIVGEWEFQNDYNLL
jgi:hypothetical protein